jgi:hypothetical protein
MKWIHFFLSMLFISASFAYGGSLQGTIRDARSLTPIVGVNLTVHIVNPDSVALPTTTDQNGTYSVTGIIPNNKVYVVLAYTDGYVRSYARVENLGALDLVYDIYLMPEAGMPPVGGSDSSAVLGTIMTPSTDNRSLIPIANAQVRLTSGNQQFDAITNSEGKYTKNIPLGLYFVTVSAAGYNNLTTTGVQVAQTGATVNAILQTTAVGILQDPEQSQPEKFVLVDAYPNPFNPSTTISFILPSQLFVSLKVFDALGKEVSTVLSEELPAGTHSQQWNAAGLPSGVYFYQLQAGSFSKTKKLVLLR